MKNLAIIVALLVGASLVARACGAPPALAGRIGITAVFAFTALGHFLKHDDMTAMIPPSLPGRSAAVYLSGLLEALLAILVLAPVYAKAAGMALCIFLVLVTPVNVYAALKRVDFGGHAGGPRYLLIRLPVQFGLIGWIYWFAIRAE